jgi:hypothetical protein
MNTWGPLAAIPSFSVVSLRQSPGFSVWSKVAAGRVDWRKLCGQMTPTPRPKPAAFDEQVREIFYGPPLPNAPAAPAAKGHF